MDWRRLALHMSPYDLKRTSAPRDSPSAIPCRRPRNPTWDVGLISSKAVAEASLQTRLFGQNKIRMVDRDEQQSPGPDNPRSPDQRQTQEYGENAAYHRIADIAIRANGDELTGRIPRSQRSLANLRKQFHAPAEQHQAACKQHNSYRAG